MQIGVFQCAGGGLSPRERLERLDATLRQRRLDLLVCPELFMSGYNVGDALIELAQPVDGSFSASVAELARNARTAIVYGYPERDADNPDDRIYNSAACMDAHGALIAHHRKLMIPPGFETRYFRPGAELTLFELNGLRCAIIICYDAEFPETVRALAAAGAQVIIVPTALADEWGAVAHRVIPARAFENGVWLVYANHGGIENDFRYLGASCIVSPDGHDAVRAGAGEQLIETRVDAHSVTTAQTRLPYLRDMKTLRRTLRHEVRFHRRSDAI